MKKYSAKELSQLAGVSVRTLHHYDAIGLLKPFARTEAQYRLYGDEELLKLQQILFYKELDLSLKEITDVLNDPDFDVMTALEEHKQALALRQRRISVMLNTIEKTILNLKGKKMITNEELYEGFSTDVRNEAIKMYGIDNVEVGEKYLKKLSKEQLEQLKSEQKEILNQLFALVDHEPEGDEVQLVVARHYKNIRKFWGTDGWADTQRKAYKGLGELYVADERFTSVNGLPQPIFAVFLSKAMAYFAQTQLR